MQQRDIRACPGLRHHNIVRLTESSFSYRAFCLATLDWPASSLAFQAVKLHDVWFVASELSFRLTGGSGYPRADNQQAAPDTIDTLLSSLTKDGYIKSVCTFEASAFLFLGLLTCWVAPTSACETLPSNTKLYQRTAKGSHTLSIRICL